MRKRSEVKDGYIVIDNNTWLGENGNVITRTYLGYSTAAKYTLTKDNGEIQDYRSLIGAKKEIWGEKRKMTIVK